MDILYILILSKNQPLNNKLMPNNIKELAQHDWKWELIFWLVFQKECPDSGNPENMG
jgi:hypothetical protein